MSTYASFNFTCRKYVLKKKKGSVVDLGCLLNLQHSCYDFEFNDYTLVILTLKYFFYLKNYRKNINQHF